MRFEWDEGKNRSNVAKHRVGFDTRILVFDDQYAPSIADRFVGDGERWQTLGMIQNIIFDCGSYLEG
jgi:uncharacterized protein